jgi:hypothetical protein
MALSIQKPLRFNWGGFFAVDNLRPDELQLCKHRRAAVDSNTERKLKTGAG